MYLRFRQLNTFTGLLILLLYSALNLYAHYTMFMLIFAMTKQEVIDVYPFEDRKDLNLKISRVLSVTYMLSIVPYTFLKLLCLVFSSVKGCNSNNGGLGLLDIMVRFPIYLFAIIFDL